LTDGKPTIVPGITTALGAIDKPAIRQWAVDQTSAFAVANIDALLSRTEQQGWGFLRWYHKREPDLENDPLRSHHIGVLNDAADLGTGMHSYMQADLLGLPLPPVTSPEMAEMVEVWQQFRWEHSIETLLVESTVVNREAGYAGTLDLFCKIDGVWYLLDIKTARGIFESAWAQVAALGACYDLMVQCDESEAEGTYRRTPPADWFGGVDKDGKITTHWRQDALPAFSRYGIIHIRPSDTDSKGNYLAPFCKLLTPESQGVDIDSHFELFLASLAVRKAQKAIKEAQRGSKD